MSRVTSGLLIAALAACTADVELTSVEQRVDGYAYAERAHCNAYACMIWSGEDTDADGIVDIDESALGTDPASHFERPSDRAVFEHIGYGTLPSWNEGRLTIVVLPTQTPEGEQIFGGESGKPAREELLRQMKMGEILGSFDLSQGIVLHPKLGGPDLSIPGLGGRPSQSDYMLAPDVASDVAKLSPLPALIDGVDVRTGNDSGTGMHWGDIDLNRRLDQQDQIKWQTLDNKSYATMVSTKNGQVVQTASLMIIDNSSGDVKETITQTKVMTKNYSSSTTFESSESPSGMYESTSSESTTKHGDGSKTNVKSSSTSDGTTSHSTTVTTIYDSEGNVIRQETIEKENNEIIKPTTCEASKDACEATGTAAAYRDPDYIAPELDMAAVALKLERAPVRLYNDPMVPPGTPNQPSGAPAPGTAVLILTTGEVESTILLRDDWKLTLEPDVDPTPAEHPTQPMPDPDECLDC